MLAARGPARVLAGIAALAVGAAAAGLLTASRAAAQQDDGQRSAVLEFPNLGPVPGAIEPALGPGPGALAPAMNLPAGTAGAGPIGGKRRVGRLPRGTKPQMAGATLVAARDMQLAAPLPAPAAAGLAAVPIPATRIDAAILQDPGPADGLTLDAAIDRMMAANLDIRALRHELPQADAEILTAGLRTNPLVYMDTQFIPYGTFNDQRPGGPTQYDLNITYPLDVSKKRHARTVVARMAKSTLEAQYQDVVRRQIDNVCRAFVNLQAARLDLLSARASVRRQEAFLAELRRAARPGDPAAADTVDHLKLVLARTKTSLGEAEGAFADAQEGLAVLLNLPGTETAALQPRGRLQTETPPPPEPEELATLALRCRPDVRAARLGIDRADAELRLQRANRFDDVYLFYDPITYQDNRPSGLPSAHSWAVGLTFALPIFNRNQGNIARAESNISQTRVELSALERRVTAEVRVAAREYQRSRTALEQIEREILPLAAATLERKTAELSEGEITADDYQGHLDDAAEITQAHRDALVRHRRAMLDLNTTVGLRILP